MRVLMFSTDREILKAGTAARMRTARYAEALGELHVIVFARGGQGAQIHEGPLHIYPTNSRSRLWYGWDALTAARALPSPEVVTAQDPFETGVAACLFAFRRHVPLHIQVHTDFLSPAYAEHSLLNRARVFIAGFVLRFAARIRVVAPRIKMAIEERYHPRADISVLPIFVNTARFRSVRHEPHPRFVHALLFVGRLEAEKRPEVAISALARLRAIGIDAGLTLVGEGSVRARLEALAKGEGVAAHVEFAGRQDPLPYYAQAELVLVPSAYEGYGMVTIEALFSGVPVLSTDSGVARESGAIIAPSDPDGFAGALCSLYARPELPHAALPSYPYASEASYIAAWRDDILATAGK